MMAAGAERVFWTTISCGGARRREADLRGGECNLECPDTAFDLNDPADLGCDSRDHPNSPCGQIAGGVFQPHQKEGGDRGRGLFSVTH